LDCEIVCVDTFLGSPEHWLTAEFRRSLRLRNGQPQLYQQFLSNVLREGMHEIITPFPISSTAATFVLRNAPQRPDIVYVDGGHEYEDVSRDIELYWGLLRPGGALIGDDFLPMWPGVIRAATEFAARKGRELQVLDEKWLVRKDAADV
jgi:hypothetical protein